MPNDEDWLRDPLMEIGAGSYKKLKNLPKEQQDHWESFHFSTRLKLEGADYFCRQVLGTASMPDTIGMPLLAYKQLKWFLDAFFFELMSAWDILLQELNIVYDLDFNPHGVKWSDTQKTKFMKKLPETILNHLVDERKKDWFRKIQSYRNTATHHSHLPLSSWKVYGQDEPWFFTEHETNMFYFDPDTEKGQQEDVKQCRNYLSEMAGHIHLVWEMVAQEFGR